MSAIDKAAAHAYQLFREHVEKYQTEIVVEPLAWRTRCDELHQDLQWLLFCRDHPLTAPPPKPRPFIPPPPLMR